MLDGRTGDINAYQTALEEAQVVGNLGTFILDLQEGVFRLVGVLARAFGRTEVRRDELAAEAPRVFHSDDEHELTRLIGTMQSLEPYEGEFRMFVGGEPRWFQGRTKIVLDDTGSATGIIGTAVDITERKLEAEKLRTLAFTDSETGMPNRAALLQGADKNFSLGALMVVHFVWIGATLPRSPENRIKNARAITRILHEIAPPGAAVYRYGDETAAITFPRNLDGTIVRPVADEIVARFANPLPVDDGTLVTSARVGIAYAGGNMVYSACELARRAEGALREAERSHPHVAVYTSALEHAHYRRSTIDRHLRFATAKHQLYALYQPIFSITSEQVTGVEALLRWNSPEIGDLKADEFIGIAEDTGVIVDIGSWILEEALAQSRRWRDAGLPPVRMSINISVRQARQPNFVASILELSEKYGIPLSDIELELTERTIIHPEGPGARNIRALRDRGVLVAVDDFGTGYSALSYLAQLEVDTLKIDKMFVAPIADEPFQRDVTETLIDLAHKRRLCVIGEGVETRSQLDCLRRMHCDQAQGFYCARPMRPDHFAALLGAA